MQTLMKQLNVAFRLGDSRHADQMIRGAIVMPAGTGATGKETLLLLQEKTSQKQKKLELDEVGSDDLIAKIAGGWTDFDRVIATPDMMGKIGRIARVLGQEV